MLSLMQLVYLVPVIVAVTLAGVFAGRNVRGRARSLMWTGIALVIVSQLSSLLTPLLVRMPRAGWLLGVHSAVSLVVGVTGTVLLIVAVGQAARPAAPVHSGPEGYRYPPAPTAPAAPGYHPQPGGHPAAGYPQPGSHGQQPPTSRSSDYGRPGAPPARHTGHSTWGTPGQ